MPRTNTARSDGRTLLLLGCAFFLLSGVVWTVIAPRALMDFRPAYFAARCLQEHRDPYNPAEMERTYAEAGEARTNESASDRMLETRNEYLPSELPFLLPMALLPLAAARVLWAGIIGAAFTLAAFLIWQESGPAPRLAGALLCVLLAGSPSLMAFGNPSALAVSLCVIAAWCFAGERRAVAGILCLAAALCIKPHTVGFVWLYFLLAGGPFRRRALQTLGVAIAFGLTGLLWVHAVAPHWVAELGTNLAAFTGRGAMNDPGPATGGGRGIHMIIDLQVVFSFLWDNPRFYNLASYAVCAPLFAVWARAALRGRASRRNAWLGLAAVSALTMLPLYHRQYDAKLILLTLPGCALLAVERGRTGRWAQALTTVAFVLDGDWTWVVLDKLLPSYHLDSIGPHISLLAFPVPLSLLALGGFYLTVFVRRARLPETAAARLV
ncbi:MAG: glycosyltransferase 87 family protein [Acidobacteriota bacterium]